MESTIDLKAPTHGLHVLAVSPRFAPTNGADTHRLRLLLGHAAANGWTVEVLAVDAADVSGPIDHWLAARLPAEVPVHRVRASRSFGLLGKGLSQRSFAPLYRKGGALLGSGRFDIVFFSTTEFALHVLGPIWQWRFGIPFCMDYQDPWVNDYYRRRPDIRPPGGRFKYALADWVHRRLEPFVVRRCAGFLAVSDTYLVDLGHRYGAGVSQKPMLVKPFPAEAEELRTLRLEFSEVQRCTPLIWRYVGRGGEIMAKSATAFFTAWRAAIERGQIASGAAEFEALGTSYVAPEQGEATFVRIASLARFGRTVRERPDRLGYSEALRALLGSDALVIFGSDDPAYTASKIYPYLLAEKPLLVIVHQSSPVVRLIQDVGGAVCVSFNENTSAVDLAESIRDKWFSNRQYTEVVPLDMVRFERYTARVQAGAVSEWLHAATDTARLSSRG